MKNLLWILLFLLTLGLLLLSTCCQSEWSFVDIMDGHVITVINNTDYSYYYEVQGIDDEGYIPYHWQIQIRVFHGDNIITLTQRENPDTIITIKENIQDDTFVYMIGE